VSGSTRRYRKNRAMVLAFATRRWICGQPARHDDPLVTDHVLPRARGGPDAAWNLRPFHASCNERKGAKWPMEVPPPRVEERDSNLIYDVDPSTGKMSSWPRALARLVTPFGARLGQCVCRSRTRMSGRSWGLLQAEAV
jgi:hypothetical protein